MAIKKRSSRRKQEIDLQGPEGNAWVLMGYARQYAKKLHLDGDAIIKEMMSSNYENLLRVFDENFGDYVDLIR